MTHLLSVHCATAAAGALQASAPRSLPYQHAARSVAAAGPAADAAAAAAAGADGAAGAAGDGGALLRGPPFDAGLSGHRLQLLQRQLRRLLPARLLRFLPGAVDGPHPVRALLLRPARGAHAAMRLPLRRQSRGDDRREAPQRSLQYWGGPCEGSSRRSPPRQISGGEVGSTSPRCQRPMFRALLCLVHRVLPHETHFCP